MDIRHLEYFLEVVRQGSFSKAAARLHITQPSISKMIKSLEDEVGVTLLHRGAKQVELTDAGRALQGHAQQIVALFQNLSAELADVTRLYKGKLRVGMPPIAGSTVFPRALGEFKKAYPNISIEMYEFGSKKIAEALNEGALDVGVVCTLPEKAEAFGVLSFVRDPLKVIVHPSHRLAGLAAVDFAALAAEPFVLYRDDFSLHDQILKRCREAGFQPHIICETSQRDFMTQMVAANLGIALLPGKICETLDPVTITAVPLTDPQLYLEMAVIWRKDRYLAFAARRWLTFTAELLGLSSRETAVVPPLSAAVD
jgi:DNA-binding transcriptional LysR family regulator